MAWANEFRNLASEIVNLHTYREEYVNQLKEDNKENMENFKAWDKERAKEVADIKAAAQNLLTELEQRDKERALEVNHLKASTQGFLKTFNERWTAEMNAGHEQRVQDLTQFKVDTEKMIAEFKAERDEAASAWKELVGNMGKGQKDPKEKKAAKETKAEEEKE